MSNLDLFGPGVAIKWLESVFEVMSCGLVNRHTFFVLTKRADRMLDTSIRTAIEWTPNIWAGVSVTNQSDADERIPLLLQVPAEHRFVSFEPLLAAVRVDPIALGEIGWVIIGAQTGPGAKPIDPQWVVDLTNQCIAAGVPIFHKDSLMGLPFDATWMRDLP